MRDGPGQSCTNRKVHCPQKTRGPQGPSVRAVSQEKGKVRCAGRESLFCSQLGSALPVETRGVLKGSPGGGARQRRWGPRVVNLAGRKTTAEPRRTEPGRPSGGRPGHQRGSRAGLCGCARPALLPAHALSDSLWSEQPRGPRPAAPSSLATTCGTGHQQGQVTPATTPAADPAHTPHASRPA